MSNGLQRAADSLNAWLFEHSLPLWWRQGRIDNGAFLEGLTLDGHPVGSRASRIRVQGRQLFCFCVAQQLGWQQPELEALLIRSAIRFGETGLRDDNVVAHKIDIDSGVIVDAETDLYDAAFFLLGLAEATRVCGQEITAPALERFFSGLDTSIRYADNAGYREALPGSQTRLQNPHMHLFEALLRLYHVTGDAALTSRIDDLLEFVERTFFDTAHGWISEEVCGPERSKTFEPGHSMEWVWLLGYHARLFDTPLHPFAQTLYDHVVTLDIAPGRMPLAIDADGDRCDPRMRLWAQTETLKAHLSMSELADDRYPQSAAHAIATANAIQQDWLGRCAISGGWFEHIDPDGTITSKFMPASSGYHVYFAISELARCATKSSDNVSA